MSDPTKTKGLRSSFTAEANRRMAQIRSATHGLLVEQDLMGARNDPTAQFMYPGHRLGAFNEWFERMLEHYLLAGDWWERFLQRAWQSGLVAGGALVGDPPAVQTTMPAVHRELARSEITGIVAAVAQQVTRQVGAAAIGGRKPLPLYQRVLPVLRKVGQARLHLAAHTMTVRLHNAGRIAQFQSAGITHVGIDPERLEPTASRNGSRTHDHVGHVRDRDAPEVRLRRQQEIQKLRRQLKLLVEGPKTEAERREIARISLPPPGVAVVEKQAEKIETTAEAVKRLRISGGRQLRGKAFVNVLTAGDDRVCNICEGLSEGGPYSIPEAIGLIPAHPRCRCAVVPAFDKRYAINRELVAEAEAN